MKRLAESVVRRRRFVRLQIGAFALVSAAVLGFGGLLVGSTVSNHPPVGLHSVVGAPQNAQLREMHPVVAGSMTAELAVTEKGWGTRFDWHCTYLANAWTSAPPEYALVVTATDGTQSTVATWTATGSTAAGLVASTAVATGDIRLVEIRSGGVTLVRSTL